MTRPPCDCLSSVDSRSAVNATIRVLMCSHAPLSHWRMIPTLLTQPPMPCVHAPSTGPTLSCNFLMHHTRSEPAASYVYATLDRDLEVLQTLPYTRPQQIISQISTAHKLSSTAVAPDQNLCQKKKKGGPRVTTSRVSRVSQVRCTDLITA